MKDWPRQGAYLERDDDDPFGDRRRLRVQLGLGLALIAMAGLGFWLVLT